jgi:hypothetical protein
MYAHKLVDCKKESWIPWSWSYRQL